MSQLTIFAPRRNTEDMGRAVEKISRRKGESTATEVLRPNRFGNRTEQKERGGGCGEEDQYLCTGNS